MKLSGDIDSRIASQVCLVFAFKVFVARIDVPSLSFLFRLDVALFTIMRFGVAFAFHFQYLPFFAVFRFRPRLMPANMGMVAPRRKGEATVFF